MAVQLSVLGLYPPPVFKTLPLAPPPQTIISLPVQTAVCWDRAAGALVVLVAVHVLSLHVAAPSKVLPKIWGPKKPTMFPLKLSASKTRLVEQGVLSSTPYFAGSFEASVTVEISAVTNRDKGKSQQICEQIALKALCDCCENAKFGKI
jgi:hypothetical protein